jgi:hypothetical protein
MINPSLTTLFRAGALQGLCARPQNVGPRPTAQWIAAEACALAEAMLAARGPKAGAPSVRDLVAGSALQGLAARPAVIGIQPDHARKELARVAYSIADAMPADTTGTTDAPIAATAPNGGATAP